MLPKKSSWFAINWYLGLKKQNKDLVFCGTESSVLFKVNCLLVVFCPKKRTKSRLFLKNKTKKPILYKPKVKKPVLFWLAWQTKPIFFFNSVFTTTTIVILTKVENKIKFLFLFFKRFFCFPKYMP